MTNDEEEWGPWVPFSGNSCPFKLGQWAYFETSRPFSDTKLKKYEGRVSNQWFIWSFWDSVTGYRIRKPKGLTLLQEIARKCDTNLIIKEKEKV